MKRVAVISDFHCGARFGLTPPPYQSNEKTNGRDKWGKIQRSLWVEFSKMLKKIDPIDSVFVLGDMIDGKGERSGGAELITSDRAEQADMAADVMFKVLSHCKPKAKVVAVRGTPYHAGKDEDWEDIVSEKVGFAKIGEHEWPSVNGCIFDIKHKIGSSAIPHGRATSLLRDVLWNEMWVAEGNRQPRAKVLLRGHVHYYMGVDMADRAAFIVPALCGQGSKFGARQCSGLVHFGMMHFDIDNKGGIQDWNKQIVVIEEQKAKVITV